MATFKAVFVSEDSVFDAEFFGEAGFEADFGAYQTVLPDPYPGPYTVTPTQETQTLATAEKSMAQDVTINPIPPQYGLITWDGSKLRVS